MRHAEPLSSRSCGSASPQHQWSSCSPLSPWFLAAPAYQSLLPGHELAPRLPRGTVGCSVQPSQCGRIAACCQWGTPHKRHSVGGLLHATLTRGQSVEAGVCNTEACLLPASPQGDDQDVISTTMGRWSRTWGCSVSALTCALRDCAALLAGHGGAHGGGWVSAGDAAPGVELCPPLPCAAHDRVRGLSPHTPPPRTARPSPDPDADAHLCSSCTHASCR